MEQYVCLSDATSEDGMLERVNNLLYTREKARDMLRYSNEYIFLPVDEYNSCRMKGLCR